METCALAGAGTNIPDTVPSLETGEVSRKIQPTIPEKYAFRAMCTALTLGKPRFQVTFRWIEVQLMTVAEPAAAGIQPTGKSPQQVVFWGQWQLHRPQNS